MSTSEAFPDRTIGALFERQAFDRPEAIALRFRDSAVSYRRLNSAANEVGQRLRRQGIVPGTVVAVAMKRTPAFVAALLGILKVGGAYLPIDLAWPATRVRSVLEVAAAPMVVASEDVPFHMWPGYVNRLVLEEDIVDTRGHSTADAESSAALAAPADPAYVNFTSGSSGVPKGVVIPHRGVVSLLFNQNYTDLSPGTVTLHYSSPAFDVTTFELWAALLHGGTCVLFDGSAPTAGRLGATIRRHDVNTMVLTATLFNMIVDTAPDILEPLSALLIGGEPLSARHVRTARGCLPHLAMSNVYGPTEVTFIATHFPLAELAPDASTVPLGYDLNHRDVVVARPDLTPAAPGEVGEIGVSGPGVALGYIGRPDLTAERFVTVRSASGAPRRIYRTGDLGRRNEAGILEFLGRADSQVKVNGYRIELDEVEQALLGHPDVKQAAVVVHGTGMTRGLKAILVAPGGVAGDLPEFLARSLPAYMIPSDVRTVDALPINTNGKVDRAALSELFNET